MDANRHAATTLNYHVARETRASTDAPFVALPRADFAAGIPWAALEQTFGTRAPFRLEDAVPASCVGQVYAAVKLLSDWSVDTNDSRRDLYKVAQWGVAQRDALTTVLLCAEVLAPTDEQRIMAFNDAARPWSADAARGLNEVVRLWAGVRRRGGALPCAALLASFDDPVSKPDEGESLTHFEEGALRNTSPVAGLLDLAGLACQTTGNDDGGPFTEAMVSAWLRTASCASTHLGSITALLQSPLTQTCGFMGAGGIHSRQSALINSALERRCMAFRAWALCYWLKLAVAAVRVVDVVSGVRFGDRPPPSAEDMFDAGFLLRIGRLRGLPGDAVRTPLPFPSGTTKLVVVQHAAPETADGAWFHLGWALHNVRALLLNATLVAAPPSRIVHLHVRAGLLALWATGLVWLNAQLSEDYGRLEQVRDGATVREITAKPALATKIGRFVSNAIPHHEPYRVQLLAAMQPGAPAAPQNAVDYDRSIGRARQALGEAAEMGSLCQRNRLAKTLSEGLVGGVITGNGLGDIFRSCIGLCILDFPFEFEFEAARSVATVLVEDAAERIVNLVLRPHGQQQDGGGPVSPNSASPSFGADDQSVTWRHTRFCTADSTRGEEVARMIDSLVPEPSAREAGTVNALTLLSNVARGAVALPLLYRFLSDGALGARACPRAPSIAWLLLNGGRDAPPVSARVDCTVVEQWAPGYFAMLNRFRTWAAPFGELARGAMQVSMSRPSGDAGVRCEEPLLRHVLPPFVQYVACGTMARAVQAEPIGRLPDAPPVLAQGLSRQEHAAVRSALAIILSLGVTSLVPNGTGLVFDPMAVPVNAIQADSVRKAYAAAYPAFSAFHHEPREVWGAWVALTGAAFAPFDRTGCAGGKLYTAVQDPEANPAVAQYQADLARFNAAQVAMNNWTAALSLHVHGRGAAPGAPPTMVTMPVAPQGATAVATTGRIVSGAAGRQVRAAAVGVRRFLAIGNKDEHGSGGLLSHLEDAASVFLAADTGALPVAAFADRIEKQAFARRPVVLLFFVQALHLSSFRWVRGGGGPLAVECLARKEPKRIAFSKTIRPQSPAPVTTGCALEAAIASAWAAINSTICCEPGHTHRALIAATTGIKRLRTGFAGLIGPEAPRETRMFFNAAHIDLGKAENAGIEALRMSALRLVQALFPIHAGSSCRGPISNAIDYRAALLIGIFFGVPTPSGFHPMAFLSALIFAIDECDSDVHGSLDACGWKWNARAVATDIECSLTSDAGVVVPAVQQQKLFDAGANTYPLVIAVGRHLADVTRQLVAAVAANQQPQVADLCDQFATLYPHTNLWQANARTIAQHAVTKITNGAAAAGNDAITDSIGWVDQVNGQAAGGATLDEWKTTPVAFRLALLEQHTSRSR